MGKTMKARIQHKHDIEANWLKAMNFTPLVSEIIVYDPDENYSYPRIKIGDGETNINDLPFITEDYAKIADIPTKPEDIGAQPVGNYLTSIPSEYVTESELNAKGYLTDYTESDPTVPDWAKTATKPTYTASEVGALPNTTKIPSTLSELGEDSEHRVVTDVEKAAWSAKSNFSGSYNDLSDKPTIPSTTGLASTTYVDNAVKNKVDKEDGKVLSTNDYTSTEKEKLSNIEAGAQKNVNADWNATSGSSQIKNKPTLGSMAAKSSVAKTDLVSGVQSSLEKADTALQPEDISSWAKASSKPSYTKSEVGLDNVDNVKQYSASNPPPYPVTSVNGKTGAVTVAVPSKVSELANDKGYITGYTESDPTVPAWAKAASKPSYTKSEVGLSNVDNTSDANKPVSTAQATAIAEAKKAGTDAQTNLTTHTDNKSNPHNVTKAQVGLGNVDNVKQYSADNPPVVAQATAPDDTSVIWVDTDDNSVDELNVSGNFVSYDKQSLTESQKAQARQNIGIPKEGYKGKKILFMGDSITASNSGWTAKIADILKPAISVKTAVSSARWCDYANTVYDGNPVFNGEDNNINNVIGNQVEKILRGKDTTHPNYSEVADYAEFDIIFIAAGTNDSTPSGDIEASFYANGSVVPVTNVDRTTWHGAFRYCIENLQRVYPDAKIFVCTPIQGVEETRPYASIKAKGDYLKQLCARMSVNCIDTMQCGICGLYEIKNANGRDLKDGLHTNENGAIKMAKYNAMMVMNYLKPEIVEDSSDTEETVNLVTTSVDANGNPYGDGNGYIDNTYISSSKLLDYGAKSGYVSTGFMPFVNGEKIYAGGSTVEFVDKDSNCRMCVYDKDKNYLGYFNGNNPDLCKIATGLNISRRYYNTSGQEVVISEGIAFVRLVAQGTGDGFIVSKKPIEQRGIQDD